MRRGIGTVSLWRCIGGKAGRSEFDRIWRIPVTFGARRNAMRIDPSVYAQPVQVQPRFVFDVLSAHGDALLVDLVKSRTTRGRVEALNMPTLHKGEVALMSSPRAWV